MHSKKERNVRNTAMPFHSKDITNQAVNLTAQGMKTIFELLIKQDTDVKRERFKTSTLNIRIL